MIKHYTYQELREWFKPRIEADTLPKSLDTPEKYYRQIAYTANTAIRYIDQVIEEQGVSAVKGDELAMAWKVYLLRLLLDLANFPEGHNKPMNTFADIIKERNEKRN